MEIKLGLKSLEARPPGLANVAFAKSRTAEDLRKFPGLPAGVLLHNRLKRWVEKHPDAEFGDHYEFGHRIVKAAVLRSLRLQGFTQREVAFAARLFGDRHDLRDDDALYSICREHARNPHPMTLFKAIQTTARTVSERFEDYYAHHKHPVLNRANDAYANSMISVHTQLDNAIYLLEKPQHLQHVLDNGNLPRLKRGFVEAYITRLQRVRQRANGKR
ncbi:MAG: hypothetical protein AABW54_04765 [Candidatus Micrarchaeota archaeon]